MCDDALAVHRGGDDALRPRPLRREEAARWGFEVPAARDANGDEAGLDGHHHGVVRSSRACAAEDLERRLEARGDVGREVWSTRADARPGGQLRPANCREPAFAEVHDAARAPPRSSAGLQAALHDPLVGTPRADHHRPADRGSDHDTGAAKGLLSLLAPTVQTICRASSHTAQRCCPTHATCTRCARRPARPRNSSPEADTRRVPVRQRLVHDRLRMFDANAEREVLSLDRDVLRREHLEDVAAECPVASTRRVASIVDPSRSVTPRSRPPSTTSPVTRTPKRTLRRRAGCPHATMMSAACSC
jgi:hypothetical protein